MALIPAPARDRPQHARYELSITLSYHPAMTVQQTRPIHAMNGLIPYNHPLGYQSGPLLSPAQQQAERRQVFTDMQAVGRFSADILEVGYQVRGSVDCSTHLALWDAFRAVGP